MMKRNSKEPHIIVPISIELDWPTVDDIVESIIEQEECFEIDSFILAGPAGGWRSLGYPSDGDFERLARVFLEVKERLKERDISLGWWDTLTVKSGRCDDFTPIVKHDGNPHPFANCPLCTAFQDKFAANVARFAKIAKPDFIIFEDDYSINAAAGGYGCFCETHLSEFSKREGRKYTRELLMEIFKERDEESLAILKRYRDLSRDSMVSLSTRIRCELDKDSPEIPMGLMQPGCADGDGDSTVAVCKALAGERHKPFCRFYGTYYNGGDTKKIPCTIYHAVHNVQHIDEEFGFYHESDTFPHTRFFASAKQMKAFLSIAYSQGFIGSTLQTQQLLDDPGEEKAYGKMIRNEKKRFGVLIDAVAKCKRNGVEIPYSPFYHNLPRGSSKIPLWVGTLSAFGIPYITTANKTAFIDAVTAAYATDEDILRYLSGNLFLDGDAALALCKRGYGKYIGISVGDNVSVGMIGYDLGAREVILPPFDSYSKGKHMPIAHMYANGNNGILRKLTPVDDGVEIISEAVTFDKRSLTPAMTRFVNSLGGKIIVMGMTLEHNLSQSLFNYRRMKLFTELLKWCDTELPLVIGEPNIHIICNESKEEESFSHIVTAINLGDDSIDGIQLYLPEKMRGKNLLELTESGEWVPVSYEGNGDGVYIFKPLESCEPLYIMFK